jgi:hypothetical protein
MASTAIDRTGFAFSKEENDTLTKVGQRSLVGDLFRQYWIAVLPASFVRAAWWSFDTG